MFGLGPATRIYLAPAAPNKKRRPHPGRQQLPAGLPRVERVIACAPEQCTCPCCEQGGVAAARIIDKGLVSDRVVIDTVVAKYSDHLPSTRWRCGGSWPGFWGIRNWS